jgi:hypothetical protein
MSTSSSNFLSKWPSENALRLASVVGLLALAMMAAGVLFPVPIVLVAGMSVAQLLGAAAFVLFLLSAAAEYRRDAQSLGSRAGGRTEASPQRE